MYLCNLVKGTIHSFDFIDMTVRKITSQSANDHPIRYNEESGEMLHWKHGQWKAIEDGQEAIIFMFNSRIDSVLLEETND